MNKQYQQQIFGWLFIVAGALMLLWASAIVIKIIAFLLGIFLINQGMTVAGYGSLWRHGQLLLFRSWMR